MTPVRSCAQEMYTPTHRFMKNFRLAWLLSKSSFALTAQSRSTRMCVPASCYNTVSVTPSIRVLTTPRWRSLSFTVSALWPPTSHSTGVSLTLVNPAECSRWVWFWFAYGSKPVFTAVLRKISNHWLADETSAVLPSLADNPATLTSGTPIQPPGWIWSKRREKNLGQSLIPLASIRAWIKSNFSSSCTNSQSCSTLAFPKRQLSGAPAGLTGGVRSMPRTLAKEDREARWSAHSLDPQPTSSTEQKLCRTGALNSKPSSQITQSWCCKERRSTSTWTL